MGRRFLNSGNLIGEVGELKRITEEVIAVADNDQLYYQKKFLAGKPNIYGEVDGHEDLDSVSSFEIILDYGSQIFQCMKGGGTEIVDNVAIEMIPNEHNEKYLQTKRDKLGHDMYLTIILQRQYYRMIVNWFVKFCCLYQSDFFIIKSSIHLN